MSWPLTGTVSFTSGRRVEGKSGIATLLDAEIGAGVKTSALFEDTRRWE